MKRFSYRILYTAFCTLFFALIRCIFGKEFLIKTNNMLPKLLLLLLERRKAVQNCTYWTRGCGGLLLMHLLGLIS